MTTQKDRAVDAGRDRVGVTITYQCVGDVFVIPLGFKYADLQRKFSLDTSFGKSQTFHCYKYATMESLRLSTELASRGILCCKSAYIEPRGITKTSPTYKYITPPLPCPELCLSRQSLQSLTNTRKALILLRVFEIVL